MERMQGGLMFDALPQLVADCDKSVDLGPIASRLVSILEETHKTGHVLIDMKPGNFMLAECPHRSKKGKVTAVSSFASAIRMIDLGLIKWFVGPNGHKANEGISQVQGTPLYCSLAVHGGNTPSRRDDMEALTYLIGDAVLTVKGSTNPTTTPVYGNDISSPPSYLPWSQENSDDAIGRVKEQQVTNPDSAYYRAMPKPAAQLLFGMFEHVRGYGYKTNPDYDGLRKRLAKLKVPIPAA